MINEEVCSFVFFKTFAESLACLTNEVRLAFYDAITNYALYDEEPDFTGANKAIWIQIAYVIDETKARRDVNKAVGKKGGRPKKVEKTTEIQKTEQSNDDAIVQQKAELGISSKGNKDYAQTIFDIFHSHNLPCCNGNFLSFYVRDFTMALENIRKLKLHSDEVIQAVKNYADVIELHRQGNSWWSNELSFSDFCKSINRFLPDNFRIDNFKQRSKEPIKANPLEGKIQL